MSPQLRNYLILFGGVFLLLLLSYELSSRTACNTALSVAEQVRH
jgi:hypothetical protein